VARLDAGTLLRLDAGTRVQVAGDMSLAEMVLAGSALVSLHGSEDVHALPEGRATVPHGAYVRLVEDARVAERTLTAGAVLFVVPGSSLAVLGKTGAVQKAAECSCHVGAALVGAALGGLVVYLLTR